MPICLPKLVDSKRRRSFIREACRQRYVCFCLCMYVYVCIHVYIYIYIYIYTRAYTHMYILYLKNMCIYTYIYSACTYIILISTYACLSAVEQPRAVMLFREIMYTIIYIHTYIHTCIHTVNACSYMYMFVGS